MILGGGTSLLGKLDKKADKASKAVTVSRDKPMGKREGGDEECSSSGVLRLLRLRLLETDAWGIQVQYDELILKNL